jgi:hypothetical protein
MDMNDVLSTLIETRFKKTRVTLESKASMYASSDNRLHNFDVGARILNSTPEQALQGMMMKHIISVLDLIEWSETMPLQITAALIDEKIGDTINYLILLEALFLRRIKSVESEVKEE